MQGSQFRWCAASSAAAPPARLTVQASALALALAPPAQHGDPFTIFENVFGGGGGGQRMHFQFGGGGGGFGGGGAWHGLFIWVYSWGCSLQPISELISATRLHAD